MKDIARMYQQCLPKSANAKSLILKRSYIKLKSTLQCNECTIFKNKYSKKAKSTLLNNKTQLNVLNPSSDVTGKDKKRTATTSTDNGAGKDKSTDLYDVDDIKGAFSPDKTSYIQEFTVRTYEVGPNRKASILTIANHLQEVATNQVVTLYGAAEEGFGADPTMAEQNLIWAITRLQLRILEYPKWSERVEMETWFSPEGRAAARRDWYIRDAMTREIIGMASSTWVCVSTKQMKMTKIPIETKEKCVPYCTSRHSIPTEETRKKIPNVDEMSQICGPIRYAGNAYMDMNGHINNVAYIVWGLDCLPLELTRNYDLSQLEIDFKAQCIPGDYVESCYSEIDSDNENEKIFIHTLQRMRDGEKEELVRLRSQWKYVE